MLTSTDGVFSLGVNWWDTPFVGAMDDLPVWSRPISGEEVADLSTQAP